MLVSDYVCYDANQLALLIKNKQVTPEEVLECAWQRMQDVNPRINAVVAECFELAYQHLAKMQGTEPYYGVPLLIKDLGFDLQGVKSTEGSRFFANNTPVVTSDFVLRLIELGFVPIGKTATPELGLSYVTEPKIFGPCRNPLDESCTPGGSSGGSAAAVAAGIAPVATASDGGGSIRIPAACCGLFGFKPTPGLTPVGPWVNEVWSGMASKHVLTRSVRDSADLLLKLVQPGRTLMPVAKKTLSITCLEGCFEDVPMASPCLDAVEYAKVLLRIAGHEVNTKKLVLDFEKIGACALTVVTANTCAIIKRQQMQCQRAPEFWELEPVTWALYRLGEQVSGYELIQAKNTLYQLVRPLHLLLQQTDVILTPALAQLPLRIGAFNTEDELDTYLKKHTQFTPFMSLFNQAGLPAMTIPVSVYQQMPVSIQLGAAWGHDLTLLSLALQIKSPKI